MKKIAKILAVVIGVIILLLVAAIIALPLVFDPNNYKPQIIQAVKTQTGRDLQINQKIHWSFFPWLGIQAGGLVLGNAQGFGPEPFARIDEAGAKVKLLPLLHKQVVVDKILLKGMTLNLAKNRAGHTNWEDFTQAQAEKPKTAPERKPGGAPAISGLTIGGIDISRTQVNWTDQQTGNKINVQNLELQSGEIASGRPADVRLAFDVQSGTPKVATRVQLSSTVAADLARQELSVSRLNLQAAGMTLNANLTGHKILEAPQFDGAVDIAPFDLKALLAKFGSPVPTNDKNALTRAAVKTQFSASASDVRLKDFVATLDNSQLTGSAEVSNFAQPAYRFDLALDNINIDRYLPPTSAAPKESRPAAGGAAPAPVVIPLDALRRLNADGSFRIHQLQAFNIRSSDVLVHLSAKDGLIKMDPSQAKLYGGAYKGATSYDARASNPLLTIDEQLTGVELGPFLKDAMAFDKFVGKGNVSAKLTAHGFNADQIKQTLNGTGGFLVQNGTIRGVDLKKMASEIDQLAKSRDAAALLQSAKSLIPGKDDVTRFSQMKGNAQVKNGVASNNDLAVQIPGLATVTGKGTANLPREELDYTVQLSGYPLRVHGPFSNLKYDPDWKAIAQKLGGKKLQQKQQQLEEKLKGRLNERLKGLLK